MMLIRNNGGFTLVEFVVTIAIASMITLAATTMLLLGLRIHHKSNTTAATLNTVSMMYSVMDTIASETENKIQVNSSETFDPENPEPWTINAGTTIRYDGTNTIYLNETPFISNVTSSYAKADENNLLTITIKTEQNNEYTFSIYCRKGVESAGQ